MIAILVLFGVKNLYSAQFRLYFVGCFQLLIEACLLYCDSYSEFHRDRDLLQQSHVATNAFTFEILLANLAIKRFTISGRFPRLTITYSSAEQVLTAAVSERKLVIRPNA